MSIELQKLTKAMISLVEKPQSKLETNWFVLYTCPRAEKVAYHELVERDYEVFLPVTRTLKVWKNRQKKWIDQVLFPSYIFVNTQQSKLYDIVRVPKVVTYIHTDGKPSVIALKEIESIKKMLCLEQEVSVETKFYAGEKVRIVHGPLAGQEGILVNQKGKTRFGIRLKEINHTVFINICRSALEKV